MKWFSKFILLASFLCFISVGISQESRVLGAWKGVKVFQDKDSYDGKTFFLPNEGEMILTASKVKLYYYPYFKSAEFDVVYKGSSLFYKINDKEIRCDFSFRGDTLAFEMNYINKTFVKLFLPTTLDLEVVNDLDQFGFRTDRLTKAFEVDTFHQDQKIGFSNYDSLGFTPIRTLHFQPDNVLLINGKKKVAYQRKYKRIVYFENGVEQELGVSHIKGTEDIHLIPLTQCECDSLVIPYLTTSWAGRIRQAIIDEENF